MILIIECMATDRRFKLMEEATNISSATWRTFWNRNSVPSGEMIAAVSQAWPEYAFWLATGISDPEYGHVAPGDQGFPKGGDRKENSATLFRKRIELKEQAIKIAEQFSNLDGFDDELHLIDSWIRTALSLIFWDRKKENQEFAKIDLQGYNAAATASNLAEKLRYAEVLLQHEVIDADSYEEASVILQKIERTLANTNGKLQPKLQAMLEKERAVIERNLRLKP